MMKGFTDSHVTGYYDYMVNMAVLLGAERARARHEMREALGLELRLAEFSLPRETRNNYTALHNPVTLAKLQTLFPGDSSSINMSNIMMTMTMMMTLMMMMTKMMMTTVMMMMMMKIMMTLMMMMMTMTMTMMTMTMTMMVMMMMMMMKDTFYYVFLGTTGHCQRVSLAEEIFITTSK